MAVIRQKLGCSHHVSEFYSPTRVVKMARIGMKGGVSLDLTVPANDGHAWDFSRKHCRDRALQITSNGRCSSCCPPSARHTRTFEFLTCAHPRARPRWSWPGAEEMSTSGSAWRCGDVTHVPETWKRYWDDISGKELKLERRSEGRRRDGSVGTPTNL